MLRWKVRPWPGQGDCWRIKNMSVAKWRPHLGIQGRMGSCHVSPYKPLKMLYLHFPSCYVLWFSWVTCLWSDQFSDRSELRSTVYVQFYMASSEEGLSVSKTDPELARWHTTRSGSKGIGQKGPSGSPGFIFKSRAVQRCLWFLSPEWDPDGG